MTLCRASCKDAYNSDFCCIQHTVLHSLSFIDALRLPGEITVTAENRHNCSTGMIVKKKYYDSNEGICNFFDKVHNVVPISS